MTRSQRQQLLDLLAIARMKMTDLDEYLELAVLHDGSRWNTSWLAVVDAIEQLDKIETRAKQTKTEEE